MGADGTSAAGIERRDSRTARAEEARIGPSEVCARREPEQDRLAGLAQRGLQRPIARPRTGRERPDTGRKPEVDALLCRAWLCWNRGGVATMMFIENTTADPPAQPEPGARSTMREP